MKRLFNKSELAIDLTSLLDVIFIVLLIVMCGQKLSTETAKQEAEDAKQTVEEARQATEEAEAVTEQYRQHEDKYENTEEYVLFIDVTATFNASSITQRHLSVFAGAASENQGIFDQEITPKNEEDIYSKLEDFLEDRIDGYIYNSPDGIIRPVILSVNKGDDNILYRDELAIETVFENIKNKEKYKDKNFIYVR